MFIIWNEFANFESFFYKYILIFVLEEIH